jgi:dTDP-4-dehydrorhamnose 3,5-epimerase
MNERFEILKTPISGLVILERKPILDSRGYLERLFCSDELRTLIPGKQIAQINHTLTAARGTIRGMHFQRPPHTETKFVSCLRGEVFDVAVDLRENSNTFLSWYAAVLSASNHKTFVIPEGFAHGFQTLTDDCEMMYFHTSVYHPDFEGGLNAGDPRLTIDWPLPVANLSQRDAAHPLLDKNFMGLAL